MFIQKAAGGLKSAYQKATGLLANQFTNKYKSRFVMPIPDGYGNDLVCEGSMYGKGHWQVYLQTKLGGGGRALQDLFTAANADVISRMDQFIDARTGMNNAAVDQAYIDHIRLPMAQKIWPSSQQPQKEKTLSL